MAHIEPDSAERREIETVLLSRHRLTIHREIVRDSFAGVEIPKLDG